MTVDETGRGRDAVQLQTGGSREGRLTAMALAKVARPHAS